MIIILRRAVVVFFELTDVVKIMCYPESNQAALFGPNEFQRDDAEDCKFVHQNDPYSSDPCLSHFGDYTYKYCRWACREGQCKCCRDGKGCPFTTLDQCQYVRQVDDYPPNACVSHFGDETYKLCPDTCRYGSCLCCNGGIGCPNQPVTKT